MQILPTNRYDKLFKKPALEAKKMPRVLEFYAQKLKSSGLLRVSAEERCNFVTLPIHGGRKFLTFTRKELFDEDLLAKSRKLIEENLTLEEKKDAEDVIETKIYMLKLQINKYVEIPEEWEIKIARILSQSVPPIVFANLVLEKVRVFVSFSHTISDLLNMKLWKTSKSSQGLQSTAYKDSGVFVSTGGNPFFDAEESKNEYDGEAALTRLMIISAQEMAHWSDIIKDKRGNYAGRFSVDGNKPNARCEEARQLDLKNISNIEARINKVNVERVSNIEEKFKIQKKFNKYSLRVLILFFRMRLNQALLLEKCRKHKLWFALTMKEKFLAQEMLSCVADMKFNAEPASSAYTNENKDLEKATFCAEALARVPQQKVKWGDRVIRFFTPNLNKYYDLVIKENIRFFEERNGKKFSNSPK